MAFNPPSRPKGASRTEEWIRKSVQWVQLNQEQFWSVVGVTVMVIVMGIFMIRHRQQETEESWNQLNIIQGQLLQGQTAAAAKSIADWEARFKGASSASYAQFLKGDLLYRTSDYASAATVYEALADKGTPVAVRPLAMSAAAASEEMAGHLPQAQAIAQNFTERYPDHFLAGSMMFTQARLTEQTGNTAGAAALYEHFATLYPQSPWTTLARARRQALTGQAASPATSVPAVISPK